MGVVRPFSEPLLMTQEQKDLINSLDIIDDKETREFRKKWINEVIKKINVNKRILSYMNSSGINYERYSKDLKKAEEELERHKRCLKRDALLDKCT